MYHTSKFNFVHQNKAFKVDECIFPLYIILQLFSSIETYSRVYNSIKKFISSEL